MPTILRVKGHRFFFFSKEGTEPPHIHVETAENYAKFWLEPIVLARTFGYNSKQIRQLREVVEEHREMFKEKWNEYFNA